MSIESIIRSLDATEARKQAAERRRSAELRELVAAVDERDRRKSGLGPEEWADLKRERASAREALRAAGHQADGPARRAAGRDIIERHPQLRCRRC